MKKKKKVELASGITLVLLLIITIIILLLSGISCGGSPDSIKRGDVASIQRTMEGETDENIQYGELPNRDKQEIKDELNAIAAEKKMRIQISSNPVFPDSASYGDFLIANNSENKYDQMVEVTKEDGELIYKSGVIPPGSYIEKAKLIKELPAGDYTCSARIYSLDENKTVCGSVVFIITVTVKN